MTSVRLRPRVTVGQVRQLAQQCHPQPRVEVAAEAHRLADDREFEGEHQPDEGEEDEDRGECAQKRYREASAPREPADQLDHGIGAEELLQGAVGRGLVEHCERACQLLQPAPPLVLGELSRSAGPAS